VELGLGKLRLVTPLLAVWFPSQQPFFFVFVLHGKTPCGTTSTPTTTYRCPCRHQSQWRLRKKKVHVSLSVCVVTSDRAQKKKKWNALFFFPCMGDLDLAPSALVTQVQKVPVALPSKLVVNLSCMVEWLCSFAG
jgi:hypothetical protein